MNERVPRVSVGLPVYNGEDYVREAIESILQQTFTDLEFIISDNCSTDRTQEICEDYARRDPRVRYLRQPRNMGASPNENLLVTEARGEFFIWINHDDIYGATLIEKCLAILEARPDVVLAYPRMMLIDTESRPIKSVEVGAHLLDEAPSRRYAKCVMTGNTVHAALGLIRLKQLRRTMMSKPFRGADQPLISELALLGKIYEVPEPLFFRRIHPGSSLKANTNHTALSAFFDTSRRMTRKPYLLLMYEYFIRAVLRHRELGLWQQFLCLLALQGWPMQQLRNWLGSLRQRTALMLLCVIHASLI